jgi:hypothetical protein
MGLVHTGYVHRARRETRRCRTCFNSTGAAPAMETALTPCSFRPWRGASSPSDPVEPLLARVAAVGVQAEDGEPPLREPPTRSPRVGRAAPGAATRIRHSYPLAKAEAVCIWNMYNIRGGIGDAPRGTHRSRGAPCALWLRARLPPGFSAALRNPLPALKSPAVGSQDAPPCPGYLWPFPSAGVPSCSPCHASSYRRIARRAKGARAFR